MKTLVLFAHPAQHHSRTNKGMVAAARGVEGITVVDLYADYPRFEIDVDREQQRLLAHDAIVFQFPLLWYSTPSLLKEWQDLVLEYGFAYGHDGTALAGKLFLPVLTAGGPEGAYRPEGRNRLPIRQMLAPLEATANLCQMPFCAPYVLFAALSDAPDTRGPHIAGYARLLAALRDDRFDAGAGTAAPHLTADTLSTVIRETTA